MHSNALPFFKVSSEHDFSNCRCHLSCSEAAWRKTYKARASTKSSAHMHFSVKPAIYKQTPIRFACMRMFLRRLRSGAGGALSGRRGTCSSTCRRGWRPRWRGPSRTSPTAPGSASSRRPSCPPHPLCSAVMHRHVRLVTISNNLQVVVWLYNLRSCCAHSCVMHRRGRRHVSHKHTIVSSALPLPDRAEQGANASY